MDAVKQEQLVQEAYERVKGDLESLRKEDLLQVNLDIPSAVTTILGVLPEVRQLRGRIAKELPAFDLKGFDRLEDYALALSLAQTHFLTATHPPDALEILSAEATSLREKLLADARALSLRGLVDAGQLAQLKGANGYKNVAQDLQILSKVMQDSWPQIQGKSATTPEELTIAFKTSARLMRVVGLREQGPAVLAAATEARLRAFTMVIRVYDEVRRAVAYLRAPEGDVDSITPTLYPHRPRRRVSEPEVMAPVPGTVPATGAVPATGSVPVAPVAMPAAAVAEQKGGPAIKDPFLS